MAVIAVRYLYAMSYDLALQCGCVVYVSHHPKTQIAHTRVIQSRGLNCRVRRHDVGLRLYLWELLPEPAYQPQPKWADPSEEIRWLA